MHAVTVDTGGFTRGRAADDRRARPKAAGVRDARLSSTAVATSSRSSRCRFSSATCCAAGVYPLSVAAERAVQAEVVAGEARRVGATAIVHGSTAPATTSSASTPRCACSLRASRCARRSATAASRARRKPAFLASAGVAIPPKTTRYSVNEGLWGTTIGGGETHDSWEIPPEELFPGNPSLEAPKRAREVVVRFEEGRPVALDGRRMGPLRLVELLNAPGRTYAAGRGIHLGDTILGAKGRIAFEAPAALALDRRARRAREARAHEGAAAVESRRSRRRTGGWCTRVSRSSRRRRGRGAIPRRLAGARDGRGPDPVSRPAGFEVVGVRSRFSLMRTDARPLRRVECVPFARARPGASARPSRFPAVSGLSPAARSPREHHSRQDRLLDRAARASARGRNLAAHRREGGSVLAVRALMEKSVYDRLELVSGRMAKINKGDVMAGTLGYRRALKGFVGIVPGLDPRRRHDPRPQSRRRAGTLRRQESGGRKPARGRGARRRPARRQAGEHRAERDSRAGRSRPVPAARRDRRHLHERGEDGRRVGDREAVRGRRSSGRGREALRASPA